MSQSNNRNNWNMFRSPEQKDLFDFFDQTQVPKRINFQTIQNLVKKTQQNDQILEDQDQWRSQLTFASNQNQDFQTQIKNNSLSSSLQNSRKQGNKPTIKNPELLSSKFNDSLQNLFIKQIKTEQNIDSSSKGDPRILFDNILTEFPKQFKASSSNFSNTQKNDKILQTLYQIKIINKQNLMINTKIYQLMKQNISNKILKNKLENNTSLIKSKLKLNSTLLMKKQNIIDEKQQILSCSKNSKKFFLHQKPLHSKTSPLTKLSTKTLKKVIKYENKSLTNKSTHNKSTKSNITTNKKSLKKNTILTLSDKIHKKLNEIQKLKLNLNTLVLHNKKVVNHHQSFIGLNTQTSKKQFKSHGVLNQQ